MPKTVAVVCLLLAPFLSGQRGQELLHAGPEAPTDAATRLRLSAIRKVAIPRIN